MRNIWEAKAKGKICIDVIAWNLCEKYREFRTDLQLLCNYDYVPVPLSYPQIVCLCVRGYFFLNVIARQTLSSDLFDIGPFMTLFEFILLIGWIKVAETLLNPFGSDDDDYECNYILNRNFSIGFEIVNQTFVPNSLPLDDGDDIFLHMLNPTPLDDLFDQKRKVEPYIGSVAAEVNKGVEGDFPFSTSTLKRRLTTYKSNKSVNKCFEQNSIRRPSVDPVHELAAHALPDMHHKLSVVEEERTPDVEKNPNGLPKRD
uniref:Bestrophin homolog n=1 Tax=Panagrolaimus sp. ES5 TaxID=591445 RepID=A0AC34GVL6_9BILA